MAVGVAAVRITYDKLVRDNVPSAIEADGHTCCVEVLAPRDYISELKRKLVEEAREALESSTHDELLLELADLSEVIESLSIAIGIAPDAVEAMRRRRREDRGGFGRRLLLRYVDRVGPPASP
jgi:predicted house-cleaning noncanonical NTP pyrophosphatase (MazG superfamily)